MGVDEVRAKAKARLALALDGNEQLADGLERLVWNQTLNHLCSNDVPLYWSDTRTPWTYTHAILKYEFNIKRNATLKKKILDGTLPLKTFATMTPVEMDPDKWTQSLENAAMRQLKSQLTVDITTIPDGAFQCGRCKSKKTNFTEVQTRSADGELVQSSLLLIVTYFILLFVCRANDAVHRMPCMWKEVETIMCQKKEARRGVSPI